MDAPALALLLILSPNLLSQSVDLSPKLVPADAQRPLQFPAADYILMSLASVLQIPEDSLLRHSCTPFL